ncbi:MAG: hypothetical protein V4613_00715 [Bacteroidota bacterium]
MINTFYALTQNSMSFDWWPCTCILFIFDLLLSVLSQSWRPQGGKWGGAIN